MKRWLWFFNLDRQSSQSSQSSQPAWIAGIKLGVPQTIVTTTIVAMALIGAAPQLGFSQTYGPAPEPAIRPVLQPGSQGSDVSELQSTLKLLGYFDDTVDGVFGNTTSAAVSRFQQAAGLSQDGIVGSATWDRLFPPNSQANAQTNTQTNAQTNTQTNSPSPTPSEPTPRPESSSSSEESANLPVLKRGSKGSAVISLQDRLRSLGLLEGSSDGVFGEGTEQAVRAAQEKYQLTPDGVVGPSTWSALMR